MTEKRFMLCISEGIDGDYDVEVWDYNKHLSLLEVVNLLNKLTDENKRWVNKYREEREKVVMFKKDCDRLIEKNKELKAKVDDKEVAVEVETCKVMEKIFDLIDKKIKEAYEGFKQTYDSWYQGQIDALTELKKELQE